MVKRKTKRGKRALSRWQLFLKASAKNKSRKLKGAKDFGAWVHQMGALYRSRLNLGHHRRVPRAIHRRGNPNNALHRAAKIAHADLAYNKKVGYGMFL